MIHQLIFAGPKPGMSEADFQKYWLETHAIKYASKIKQIKKYMVDTRVDFSGDRGREPMFGGIAEIWLKSEEEQLESLQSPEFLEGARLDEPKWAAFWKTLVLDTDTHLVFDAPAGAKPASVKLVVLTRRTPGKSIEDFRSHALNTHAKLLPDVPGLRKAAFCTTRDSWYGFGEPRFDMAAMFWFDDIEALDGALASPAFKTLIEDDANFCDPENTFAMAVEEHWIIGPEARA